MRMKIMLPALIISIITGCSSPKHKRIIGLWQVNYVEMINWNEFERDMRKIAAKNIERAIDSEFTGENDKKTFADQIQKIREKAFEDFKVNFTEAKNSIEGNIKRSIIEYKIDNSSETKIGNDLSDKGRWDLIENGTVLLETNQFGKQTRSKILTFTQEKLEMEMNLSLRATMGETEANVYDENNLAPLLDYNLKFRIVLSKL